MGSKKDDTPLRQVPVPEEHNSEAPTENVPEQHAEPAQPIEHIPMHSQVQPAEGKPVHAIYEIRNLVKDSLASAGNEVKDIITSSLHKEEISRRAAACQKVMERIAAAEDELKRIKPKYAGVSLDNKPIGEPIYTPEDAKKYKETNELLCKLHAALNNAIKDHVFTKVFELGK